MKKCILKYPGAKNKISDWIVSFIPEHQVYLEPFAGSLAILFNKPKAPVETVNDLDNDIVNYFKCLRDHPNELAEAIKNTPYARCEYDRAYSAEKSDNEIEKARKFAVKCFQGFGNSSLYHNGFRSGQQRNSPNCAAAWNQLPKTLLKATERLKEVQIECLPAIELIKRYNTADVFIYADPPYFPGTRKNYLYRNEMNDQDHIDLLELLKHHPGKVLLSGYDNELYDSILMDWHKEYREAQAEKGLKRTECLWMNYEIQMKLF